MSRQEIVTAVNRILADSETCTAAVETMRPIVSDAALVERFDRTYSAHVVTLLQDVLCRYALLALCRMWDEDKDTQSIPSLVAVLPNLTDSSQAMGQRINQIERIVNGVLNSDRLDRLRNWRDKNLGHALAESRREKKGGPIADPIWDDIFALGRQARVIVEAVASAAGTAIDSAEQQRIYARNADAFWGSFVEKPR